MFQPYAAWFGMISTLIICFFSGWVSTVYSASSFVSNLLTHVSPAQTVFLKDSWQTDTFLTNYLPLILFPIIYIGARFYYKQPLVNAVDMDFRSDIAEIEADEVPEDPPKNMLESFWRWLVSPDHLTRLNILISNGHVICRCDCFRSCVDPSVFNFDPCYYTPRYPRWSPSAVAAIDIFTVYYNAYSTLLEILCQLFVRS